jgi:hypothetical protein
MKARIVDVVEYNSRKALSRHTAPFVRQLIKRHLIVTTDFYSSLLAMCTAMAKFTVLLSLHRSVLGI